MLLRPLNSSFWSSDKFCIDSVQSTRKESIESTDSLFIDSIFEILAELISTNLEVKEAIEFLESEKVDNELFGKMKNI